MVGTIMVEMRGTKHQKKKKKNQKALTTLVIQLVDLLKMGTNADQGMRPNKEEQRGCTFEQFNKQHPLFLKDIQMRWLRRTGSYR
jgi:type II secretory pathway component PulF